MKILVTGAAGFIGSHLCQRLLARGDEVVGLDNFDPFYDHRVKERNLEPFLQHEKFRFFQRDIRQADELSDMWKNHCDGVEAVVHLAARAGVRPSIADPQGYEQTNILGTMNMLTQAVAAKPMPKFIFASSSSVYGNNPTVPFGESDRVDNPISPYAATKKACELLCYTYHHLHGLPMTALRFFTVYGPRQRPDLAIHKFTGQILRGEPIEMFGDGKSSRDYTYIDDIIAGVAAAIDRCDGYEIINLGSETPITLREMIATVERATGQAAEIIEKPLQSGDVNRTFADIAKAKKLLDYQPNMPFEKGVEKFVAWWKNN